MERSCWGRTPIGPDRLLAVETDVQRHLVATVRAVSVGCQVGGRVSHRNDDDPRDAARALSTLGCHLGTSSGRGQRVTLPRNLLDEDVAKKLSDVVATLVGRNSPTVLGHEHDRYGTKSSCAEGTSAGLLLGVVENVGLDDHDAERDALFGDFGSTKLHGGAPPDAGEL